MLEAERDNTHLPLDPEKTYTIRITLLLGELFPLFYNALTYFNINQASTKKQSFIQIGKQQFWLEDVVIDNNDPSGWTGYISLATLVEQAKTHRFHSSEPLTLEFASLTTFNRNSSRNKIYGTHHALLPLPMYVFPGLARRWEDTAPPELRNIVQKDRIEQYIQDDGLIIADYDLRPHSVRFTTHQQMGFVGTCTYSLRGPDEPTTPEAPLTVRQQLLLLSKLAFYSGVGYKTTMGMGRTRLV